MTDDPTKRLERVASRADADSRTGPVLFSVRLRSGQVAEYGQPDRPFFLASVTKLFVTVLLSQLRAQGSVDWDAPFGRYLPNVDTARLHVLDGVDRTSQITVRQLMAHTSGLPDYFEGRRHDGTTTFTLMVDRDFSWDLTDVLAWTRGMQAHFPPGAPRRALYSDTNYQLLGAIIEAHTGRTFGEVVRERICAPLGLADTYCFDHTTLDRFAQVAPMYHGSVPLTRPKAMASTGADGAMVSTLQDGQRFLGAFFDGSLIQHAVLADIQTDWRRVFGPIMYGTGVMRFQLPRVFSPLRRPPAFVGHSGASGVVMYLHRESGRTVVGTVNQTKHRSLPYRLMLQTLR